MEKTHTYLTIPSDDQPDRSAAHNNLADTYWYNGWVRLTKGPQTVTPTVSSHHCNVYQQNSRATNTHAVDVLLLQAWVPRPSSALPPTGC